MRKILIAACAALFWAAALFAADPATGLWKSIDDKTNKVTAVWSLYEENGMLFGKILAVADAPQDVVASNCKKVYKDFPASGDVSKMRIVGTTWIFNMQKDSNGNWSKGSVIDPNNGNMYGCVMNYIAAGEKHKKYTATVPTLAMAGTVGPIKVFQYWTQATEADVAELQTKFPAGK